jgi:hypothetical protein
MKNTLDTAFNLNMKLQEEILSDGSKVYNIIIGNETIACVDFDSALFAFRKIEKIVDDAAA